MDISIEATELTGPMRFSQISVQMEWRANHGCSDSCEEIKRRRRGNEKHFYGEK